MVIAKVGHPVQFLSSTEAYIYTILYIQYEQQIFNKTIYIRENFQDILNLSWQSLRIRRFNLKYFISYFILCYCRRIFKISQKILMKGKFGNLLRYFVSQRRIVGAEISCVVYFKSGRSAHR